jgi:hypothetical protein
VVFGLARGFLILGIFYLPIHEMMDNEIKESWFKESKTHIVIESVSTGVQKFMPASFLSEKNSDTDKKIDGGKDPTSKIMGGVLDQINTIKSESSGTMPPASTGEALPDQKPQGYTPDARDTLEKLIEKAP